MSEKIGEVLVNYEACTQQDIKQALDIQQKVGGRLGSILLNVGAVTEEQLLVALSTQLSVPLYRKNSNNLKPYLPTGITRDFFVSFKMCLCRQSDDGLQLVTTDPLAQELIARVELTCHTSLSILLASESEIDQLLAELIEGSNSDNTLQSSTLEFGDELDKLKELASEAPVIKLVNRIISKAVETRASDIHFESFRYKPRVRFRTDGLLKTVEQIPSSLQVSVIARLKLISGMNIAESRLPQDGRISLRVAGKEIDIRASSVPTSFGESFVLRILKKEDISYSLDSLGFYPDHLEMIRELIARPNGIYLTTGPTGSGKTTTLYSALTELNQEQRKIITVEDPVEYELAGVSQIHVQEKIDYTFASALRSILRQDPDIIMIGEIRDKETAKIAVQSALTGHLVLSTLHTNSALASVTRLLDMGVESFLIKATVVGLMAQRLVRLLCKYCAKPDEHYQGIASTYNLETLLSKYPHISLNPQKACGCEQCNDTGYFGRMVIAEVVPFDRKIQQAMEEGSLKDDASMYGYRTMLEDGLCKYAEGLTSIDEIAKIVR
ncbi:Flp pilus assembly complex ATPase component TadA [Desulfocapsa sp. AH-315-G09]|uniref:Flp pilus assembly complex ATPase component TadA n=1 Tax=Desulfotalea psychrophila TaxID=84980 RepID=A0ABS3AUE7_9BACT|nr:Flp pilus assembly complex ATPase component TadA [Desulfocapsa sp.]MBN4063955.1 Flp pilus assembly complex ATPase component TadA [bacterium AH-315-I07]MBN4065431.1 Flp pilus assembly complex ATPase component TadA [Desulfocapsa sp. AH-315-G09]MBN4068709.1 Flp pilus assembly complex ATPase component TadA [Desulfotalea psychrophila]